MLALEKIVLKLANQAFSPNTKKYLRISVQKIIKTSKMPCRFLSQTSVIWQESISIPVLYNKQFEFQIFEKHEFGYNPEQLQSIYYGTLIIHNIEEKSNTWQVFSNNNQKIGFLSANIISKSSNPTQPTESNHFHINSIVVNLQNLKLKKAYAIIKYGEQKIKTAQVKCRGGSELVFLQGYQFNRRQENTEAKIQIYCFNQRKNSSELVGIGSLDITDLSSNKNIQFKSNGQNVGYGYVKLKKGKNNSINSIKNMKQSLKQSQTIAEYDNSTRTAKKIPPIPSIPSVEDFFYNIKTQNQTKKQMSPRQKKVSIVNKNNDIVFPKEKRFMSYEDRQSSIISHLKQRNFDMINKHSMKYYRGASLGYGDKSDFTKQKVNIPGVGRYKLPSIWDRY